jgi:hypothetical protein
VYDIFGTDATTVKISSSIGISRSSDVGSFVFYNNQANATAWWYACTAAANGGAAFRKDSGGVTHLTDTLGFIGGTGSAYQNFDSATDTITFSVATDSSLSSWPGNGNFTSQTVTFRDPLNADFHLATSDTGARGRGTNLATDPILPVVDDIDGDARPASPTPWDIGADQEP